MSDQHQEQTRIITSDLAFWVVLRKSTESTSFNAYAKEMDVMLCELSETSRTTDQIQDWRLKLALPYNNAEAYQHLKVATEAFLKANCGVKLDEYEFEPGDNETVAGRLGVDLEDIDLEQQWTRYLKEINGSESQTIPYLAIIRQNLGHRHLQFQEKELEKEEDGDASHAQCLSAISAKLTRPCFFELIWNYWMEELLLVQCMHAISQRFQNVRSANERNPLVNMEISPLRPLSNLLWGYIQDEPHRLSVPRRAYEYDHHYGLRLIGKAVRNFRPADSRSKFLEAFHHLLHLCAAFFKQEDNTTVLADGFPILNALKQVHLILSEGGGGQFGDMPTVARQEMLMQQWLMARPHMNQFLSSRPMVAYPEPWMDSVDAMRRLQGWDNGSVLDYSNLAAFGEQLLLSIRYGDWFDTHDRERAANWVRFWRSEIQGYTHAYKAVTGVDLSREASHVMPSELLHNRSSTKTRA